MTSIDDDRRAAGSGRPVLVVVDDHESTRRIVAKSLRRRFGPDYDVVVPEGTEDARSELQRLHGAGADAALIVANEHLRSGSGTEFLASTRDIYPTARRLVLADFGDNWVMPSIARASTLGEVDHFEYLPWGENDEQFLAAIGDILADWSFENSRGDSRMTIIGERGEPTFHLLGEVLQRWQTYPVAMVEAGTPEGEQVHGRARYPGPAADRGAVGRQVR